MSERRGARRVLPLLILMTLLAGLAGAAAPGPSAVEAAANAAVFGNRRFTVPANGTLEVTIRGYCLDKERHFPGSYLEPSDHRVNDEVLRTFAYAVAKGFVRKQIYQVQLAIWFLRGNQWFNTMRPRDVAEGIVQQSRGAPLPEKPTDAPTLIEAIQSGAIKASVNDFHATTENYEGEGTLLLTNTTDQPYTLYVTVGTVFKGANDGEQRMLTWAQGGLNTYTRGPGGSGYALNVRAVDSKRFPNVAAQVSVLDNRQMPVRDLTSDRFEVTEDGKPVEEVVVKQVADGAAGEPLSLVLLVEGSDNALRAEGADNTAYLASQFVDGLKDKDQVLVSGFSERPYTVQDRTEDKAGASKQIQAMKPGREARFYDALAAALVSVDKLPPARRGIVVFASGRDTGSDPDPSDVLDWAAEQGTPIFTVASGNADRNVLRAFAEATGGLTFDVSSAADLEAAFAAITSYLREAYRVEFTSNLPADGKQHKLVARIKGNETLRPGDSTFLAYKNPPAIEVIEPRDNARLGATQRVEFNIRSVAPVTEVELVANGKPLTTLRSEPWVYDWQTTGLSRGQNSLNIIALDKAGNRSVKTVPVIVPAENLEREQYSGPAGPIERESGPNLLPILFGVLAIAGLGAGGYFASQRVLPELQKRRPSRCPIHGVSFPREGACPQCLQEARSRINERLGQFTPRSEQVGGD